MKFNGPLLADFVDGFTAKSRSLIGKSFNRERVAEWAFRKKLKPGSYLSKCLSLTPDSRLNASVVNSILTACRGRMIEQLRGLVVDAENRVAEFERGLCYELQLSTSGCATANDFILERRFETATTPQEFGVPDIQGWREGTFGFSENLRAVQKYSASVMDHLVTRLGRTSDSLRRLELLDVAFSIAALHHPGTRSHKSMLHQALSAADRAGLHTLAHSPNVPEDIRLRALSLAVDLRSLSFRPTMNSPANVLVGALAGTRLSDAEWPAIQADVRETVTGTERLLEIDPQSSRVHLIRAAYLSQYARLLAATGCDDHVRKADSLARLSLTHADHCTYPEGRIYPIQRSLLQGKVDIAIKNCEKTITILDRDGRHEAATAFSALLVQLTHRYGGSPTADSHIRRLAREAARSSSTSYQYSHIFSASSVRKLVGAGRPPKSC